MEIEYLKHLEDNPESLPGFDQVNEPLTLPEIETLEGLYNNSNPFPKALREYLFLAGTFSWMLGGYMPSTQTYFREQLVKHNMEINRPFFVLLTIDETVDLVYLDEGENDPKFYMAEDYTEPATQGGNTPEILYTGQTLSERIDYLMLATRNLYK